MLKDEVPSYISFFLKVVLSIGCLALSSCLLWISGAGPAGESEGRVGNAEPTNGSAGEQLQGVGALAWPVREATTGQPTVCCFLFFFKASLAFCLKYGAVNLF